LSFEEWGEQKVNTLTVEIPVVGAENENDFTG
jgi:hypothetical protein